MRRRIRQLTNSVFTTASGASVFLMVAALVIILGSIVWQGAGAVVFRGTVDFRRMQLELYGRGDGDAVNAEIADTEQLRTEVYGIIDEFAAVIDTSSKQKRVRRIYREFKKQLSNRCDNKLLTADEAKVLTAQAKKMRDLLLEAYQSTDRVMITRCVENIVGNTEVDRTHFAGTVADELFGMAEEYGQIASTMDLSQRDKYSVAFEEAQKIARRLIGPRPGVIRPELVQNRFGTTRWDMVQAELNNLLWIDEWSYDDTTEKLIKTRKPRRDQFAGTGLVKLFDYFEEHSDKMFLPRMTFYRQYFTDDSTLGHFFGGVGPETLGTMLLTLLCMLFAFPLGVVSAAYLAEHDESTPVISIIRMCINTLAGIPSIVFGLFGLAFFVMYVQPRLGMSSQSTILAGALTLAVLVLPVVIRASEEAIRAVPRPYKEASLALGATELRTFITVTFPAALPGILTGVILSMSRAAGETAPILFTAAVAMGPIPLSLAEPTRTLSYGSYDIAVGDRLSMRVPHQQFGMVMTLVLLVFLLNLTAIIIRWRVSKRLHN